MNSKKQAFIYATSDFLTATFAWFFFFLFRKKVIEPQKFGHSIPIEFDNTFYFGLILIPLFWIILYYATGFELRTVRVVLDY